MREYGFDADNYPQILEMQKLERALFAEFQAVEESDAKEDGEA
jgi:hypothetical protein